MRAFFQFFLFFTYGALHIYRKLTYIFKWHRCIDLAASEHDVVPIAHFQYKPIRFQHGLKSIMTHATLHLVELHLFSVQPDD